MVWAVVLDHYPLLDTATEQLKFSILIEILEEVALMNMPMTELLRHAYLLALTCFLSGCGSSQPPIVASPQLSADSPAVVKYLQEQSRRLELRKDLPADIRGGPKKVTFDKKFGYSPSPDTIGYVRVVRLVQKLSESQSLISLDGAILVLANFDVGSAADGSEIGLGKFLYVGEPISYRTVTGATNRAYSVVPVPLETLIDAGE